MESATIEQAWERYATSGRTPRRDVNAAGQATWFNWTSHQDYGPDETILGPLTDRSVLELGSGTGCNLAHLTTRGAHCTGMDVSPTQNAKARERWGHMPGLAFITGEALEFLTATDETFDVVYSVFGAHWFTNPDMLLPLVRKRLSAGGVYAFSNTAAEDVPPLGPKAAVTRFDFTRATWEFTLRSHGLHNVHVEVLPPPADGGQRTGLAVGRT
ncbi:SAM-dependent methyltransferase [Streptacidiphilus sp. BW17]|uniref:class I SAM-dependent DNA methyltransferase n=1 Tax=Streptacidiphilus sp. BW17 TaxID=3156274 RepID=UPI003518EE5A